MTLFAEWRHLAIYFANSSVKNQQTSLPGSVFRNMYIVTYDIASYYRKAASPDLCAALPNAVEKLMLAIFLYC
jgi:hypothetical protein